VVENNITLPTSKQCKSRHVSYAKRAEMTSLIVHASVV